MSTTDVTASVNPSELTPLEPKGTRARIRLPFLKVPQVSESPFPERPHG